MRSIILSVFFLIALFFADPGYSASFEEDILCYMGIKSDCLRTHKNRPNGIFPAGARLLPGESIWSPRGKLELSFQRDGNLVLFHRGQVIWATGTTGSGARECVMQRDGNLVLYGHRGHPLWASETQGNAGAFLVLQDDGNLVIYKPVHPIWATGTNR